MEDIKMKKIYQTPETKLVKIANERLLVKVSGGEADGGVEADAREFSGLIWEEEEVQ